MKFKKDVVATLATVAAVLVALFAIFVTIPVWFEAVVITLAVVGAFITVNEIVKARKASYDETTGKHTYKFPVREIVFGTLILVSIAAIVLLSLKRLFGFALIPVAVLLAILLVIALLKKLRIMQIVVGLILALLVVSIIGYFTSALVHKGVNLNPGVSVETTAPETDAPETDAPETDAPETDAPETDAPETDAPETDAPETNAPETEQKPNVEDKNDNTPEDKPVQNVTKPEDNTPEDTFTPVIVKINAPATIKYAEPITITLEGVKAENLRFGNEDFLYVEIISETEVEVTLIGIVNDAGEVELVPAAGYITVTDAETGANTTIEIVE